MTRIHEKTDYKQVIELSSAHFKQYSVNHSNVLLNLGLPSPPCLPRFGK